MDVLAGMRAFRAVAEAGSYVGAGRTLAVSTAWVSKLVLQLEEHLGVQLLVRTTRRLTLTDAGRGYLERCVRILDDIDESERALSDLQSAPRGLLRVSAPMSFGLLRLAAKLPEFLRRFPDVELDVSFNDRRVDVIEDGIDVAVRIGAELEDSSLVARKLAEGRRVVCASKDYVRTHGAPKQPRDLEKHVCLRYSLHEPPGRWEFERRGERVQVNVRGPLRIDNSIALREAALAGVGVFLTPDFVVEGDLRAGKLVPLLETWHPSGYAIFAVSPPSRFATPKARAFVDFLRAALGSERSR